jgi:UDP-N-acetyl-D-mannosaminuronate dehydrogenase
MFDGTTEIISDVSFLLPSFEYTHIICVPTEKEGVPCNDFIFDVIKEIIKLEKNNPSPAVLIESTMTPGTACVVLELLEKALPNADVKFGVSPRRDWFTKEGRTLETIWRVYGANTDSSADYFMNLLSIVSIN